MRARSDVIGDHAVTIVATAPRSAIWRPLFEALSSVLIALAIAGAALVFAMLLQVRVGLRPLQALRAGRRRRPRGEARPDSFPTNLAKSHRWSTN